MGDPKRSAAELLGGTVGGMMQVMVGHPLDTIKVRVQSKGLGYTSPMQCAQQTMRTEGFRGFYKGVTPPLIMTGIINGVIFAVNGQMKRLVAWASDTNPDSLSTPQVLTAALMTAPVYTVILSPTEFVKSRLQYQADSVSKLYSGPVDVIRQTLKQEGIRGIYRGYVATTATRMLGAPCYFVVYDEIKRKLSDNGVKKLGPAEIIFAGGMAGCAFWAANYPVDMAKTRIQTGRGDAAKMGLFSTMKEIHAEGGIRNFYRGFGVCLVRAFPANAAVYLGLEMTLQLFGYSSF